MAHHYNKRPLVCTVQDCDRPANKPGCGNGLCNKHYQMMRTHGRTHIVNAPVGQGHLNKITGYVEAYHPETGTKTYEHILLAESVLGKPLPPKAIVHHVTENRSDNHGQFKLVICPNQEYHFLIHKLMREKGISFKNGWPNPSIAGGPKIPAPVVKDWANLSLKDLSK